jgi:hypothetical protein
MRKVTQDCFDKNLLYIYNNNFYNNALLPDENKKILNQSLNDYKYFLSSKKTDKYTISAQLPEGVTCKHCVLQWKYHAGNNYGLTNSTTGNGCSGCTDIQEIFFNCADIEILEESEYLMRKKLNQLRPTAEFNETKYGIPVIVEYTTYAIPSSSKNYFGSWILILFLFSLSF